MKRTTIVLFALTVLAHPTLAQDSIDTGYTAYLGPDDYFNSSGVRLETVCDIARQDRANYHRFGIRHEWDQNDSIFASAEMRELFSSKCLVTQGVSPEKIISGDEPYIGVLIRRNADGEISQIRIGYRAG